MTLLILFSGHGAVGGSISGAHHYSGGKRWWEELQEEYRQQYDRERPSQARQAVKARKATKKIAEEAVEDGLLTPFNAAPIAQLLASVQNAAKVSDALEASKAFMAAMERLREEDEEDAILLLS